MPSASVPAGRGQHLGSARPPPRGAPGGGRRRLLGRIYVAGGYRADGSSASTVEVYDPATDRWTMAAPLPQGLNHPAAAVVASASTCSAATTAAARWRRTTSTTRGRTRGRCARRCPPRAARPWPRCSGDGSTWPAARPTPWGGRSKPTTRRRTLDVAARRCPRAQPPGGRRHRGPAVRGGRPAAPHAVRARGLRPRDDTWSTRAPMPTGRSGHAAAVVRGCLYVFGGEGNPRSDRRRLPPERGLRSRATNTWRASPPCGPRATASAPPSSATASSFPAARPCRVGAVATHDAYEAPASRSCS